MRFHVELVENQLDAVPRRGYEVPNAVRIWGIGIRVIGTENRAEGGGDLVFALALLAIVAILVHGVPVVAHADVGSNRVPALMLTTTIIHGTLVDVREEDGREA